MVDLGSSDVSALTPHMATTNYTAIVCGMSSTRCVRRSDRMDSRMSKWPDVAGRVAGDVDEATLITCGTYELAADEYADSTEDYDLFPGLKGEVLDFERNMPPGLPALDLGCGGGRDSRLLAGLGRQVVSADFAMTMLRCARSRAHGEPKNPQYVQLNLLDLPFSDGRFGGIWASGSLLHLPSARIPQGLSEIHRTLAVGGITAISMRSGTGEGWRKGGRMAGARWFTLVDQGDLASAMRTTGFCDVRIRATGRQDWFVALGFK